MLSKTKRFTGVVVAALIVSAGIPAGTAAATLAPCRAVVSQSTGSEVAIVLTGEYLDRAGGNVLLTCVIVQNGVRVVSVQDPILVGSFAALASDERLGTDPFYVCYEVQTWFMVDDFGSNYHHTNC